LHSLTIFVEENNGDEYSVLSGLKIYGVTIDGMNVAAIHEQKKDA